jgi:hypothetical protein
VSGALTDGPGVEEAQGRIVAVPPRRDARLSPSRPLAPSRSGSRPTPTSCSPGCRRTHPTPVRRSFWVRAGTSGRALRRRRARQSPPALATAPQGTQSSTPERSDDRNPWTVSAREQLAALLLVEQSSHAASVTAPGVTRQRAIEAPSLLHSGDDGCPRRRSPSPFRPPDRTIAMATHRSRGRRRPRDRFATKGLAGSGRHPCIPMATLQWAGRATGRRMAWSRSPSDARCWQTSPPSLADVLARRARVRKRT